MVNVTVFNSFVGVGLTVMDGVALTAGAVVLDVASAVNVRVAVRATVSPVGRVRVDGAGKKEDDGVATDAHPTTSIPTKIATQEEKHASDAIARSPTRPRTTPDLGRAFSTYRGRRLCSRSRRLLCQRG